MKYARSFFVTLGEDSECTLTVTAPGSGQIPQPELLELLELLDREEDDRLELELDEDRLLELEFVMLLELNDDRLLELEFVMLLELNDDRLLELEFVMLLELEEELLEEELMAR